jgi:hypothetical protein
VSVTDGFELLHRVGAPRYAGSREGQPWATLYYAVALDASHFGSQPTSMRRLPEGAHLCR